MSEIDLDRINVEPLGNLRSSNFEVDITPFLDYIDNGGDFSQTFKTDLDLKYEPIPIEAPEITKENDAGPYNFEISIDQSNGGTKNNLWIFSETLNKLFVTMNSHFPVHFKYDFNSLEGIEMYVRAKPVYCQTQFANEMVLRCLQHSSALDTTNKESPDIMWPHIMWCQSKEAIYEGSKETNSHFNVRVPVGRPRTGVDYIPQLYKFMCKNSCPGNGMNRRPINVVFTLEDIQGRIFGRKVCGVRICSCPKRDKDKEEKEYYKSNNIVPSNPLPNGKKRKIEKPASSPDYSDKTIYDLNLKVVGKANAYAILKYAQDLMAGDSYRTGEIHPYKEVISDISTKMNNYQQQQ